jgi:hypothetical protein
MWLFNHAIAPYSQQTVDHQTHGFAVEQSPGVTARPHVAGSWQRRASTTSCLESRAMVCGAAKLRRPPMFQPLHQHRMAFDPLPLVVPRDSWCIQRTGGGHHAIATGINAAANDPHPTARRSGTANGWNWNLAVPMAARSPVFQWSWSVGLPIWLGITSSNLDDQEFISKR